MNYNIIATGSTGNCVVINDVIAVDMGVSFKALKEVYRSLQIVLLTHIHSDHFNGKTIKRLTDERPTLRVGCCEWLVKPLLDCGVDSSRIDVYEINKTYDYRAFKISPVELIHDVPQAGYRIFINDEKALYATDTKDISHIKADNYNLYLVEANYEDEELQERIDEKLEAGEYCYELNVANRHLSLQQASDWLMENMGDKSDYVFLHGHVDKDKSKEEWGYQDE